MIIELLIDFVALALLGSLGILCFGGAIWMLQGNRDITADPRENKFIDLLPLEGRCMDCGTIYRHGRQPTSHGLCSTCEATRWKGIHEVACK